MSALLSKAQWAEAVGVTTKTVERWLAVGLPTQRVRQGQRWFFPAGTPRPTSEDVAAAEAAIAGATSRDVAPVAPSRDRLGALPPAGATIAPAVAVGGTLEEFAAMLGCSRTGVRRLYADIRATPGLPFYVGPYGPHGALRTVAFPRQ